MAWPNNTRRYVHHLGQKSRPTGGGVVTYDLPKVGILAGITLVVEGTVAGTISAPNALGMASIISLVRLTLNSAVDLINLTGAAYHYLARDMFETGNDPVSQSNARVAVSATTFDISMWLPLAINSRDQQGLILLQNEQTQAQLTVEFLADASVATGVTSIVTTVDPWLELFTVPVRDEDLPDFAMAQTLTSESRAVSGAGDVTFDWPRANTYLQLVHGCGIGASPTDAWSKAQLRIAQNQYIYGNLSPDLADREFSRYRGRTRLAGVIPFDMMSSSGLGNYAGARDALETSQVTDLATIITATGATTLHTFKRQLVPLAQG